MRRLTSMFIHVRFKSSPLRTAVWIANITADRICGVRDASKAMFSRVNSPGLSRRSRSSRARGIVTESKGLLSSGPPPLTSRDVQDAAKKGQFAPDAAELYSCESVVSVSGYGAGSHACDDESSSALYHRP